MKTEDLFEETYSAITVNKVRSGLTMLGIVIGIASVIAMVSIGQGTQASISASINSLGANLLIVMPGAQRSFGSTVSSGLGSSHTLTPDDANAIGSSVQNVAAVSPSVTAREQVVYKGNNTNVTVTGAVSAYPQVRNVQIDEGSFISDTDNADANRVAVIGPTVLQTLWNPQGTATATPDQAIGQIIRIGGQNFTVIGVTVSKGGSGFANQDNVIYVPLLSAQRYFIGDTSYVTEIDIEAASQQSMTQVQNDVTNLLLERHNIADPTSADFNILNQADIVQTASSVTNTFTLLLASIAAISLLVGGIGIMNMMLTTVTERTREIGLRKAIGAKKADITLQFLGESVMLTFAGGLVGVVLGWVASIAISYFSGITTTVSIPYVLLAFGVSAAIGIIFGYYPAKRAASLNPIEALRYE
ncbi:MAG TPA: ABC transporter permease [Candidatus Paceibacterota bacterium]|nr:ABC transporter permease [Candidatus Paceibacterota bacterium]